MPTFIELLLDAMQKPAIWNKGWKEYAGCINRQTEKRYRGRNAFYLSVATVMHSFAHNQWLTFKQATEMGGKIIKGSKGFKVMFYTYLESKNEKTGETERAPMVRQYTVFNISQIEGIDPIVYDIPDNVELSQTALKPIMNYIEKENITLQQGSETNYYAPKLDFISVIEPKFRDNINHYYQTLYHEITHSTGHSQRLNRKEVVNGIKFGSHDYSIEELVAEFGSCMLASELGVEIDYERSGSYLASRASKIKEDKKEREVERAIARATKSTDYVLCK